MTDDQSNNMSLEDKLYRTKYEPDPSHPHIKVDQEKTKQKHDRNKKLLKVCPAEVYKEDPNDPDQINASHENCLECGTCRQVVKDDSIEWKQPDGGMGVKYRHG